MRTVKTLPVPALQQTLERLEEVVRAVVDPQTAQGTREAIRRFREGPGPRLQERLEAFAAAEDREGRNWMSEEWFRGYLANRESLPLSTNVSFQINPDTAQPGHNTASHDAAAPGHQPLTGLDRAAAFLHRAAAVHLAQARGETAPEQDARGTTMDPDQWLCLNGGLRHPATPADRYLPCTLGGADREIGIFHRGRLFLVRISDSHGRPLTPGQLRAALAEVLDAAASPTTAPSENAGPGNAGLATENPATDNPGTPIGFAELSSLGSEEAAQLLDALLEDSENAETYSRLRNMLFTASLEEHAREDAEHLRALSFEPGRVWTRRPISYEIGLADDWLCAHVEHTMIDGATLVEVIRRMQATELPEAAADERPEAPENTQRPENTAPTPLTWRLTPEQERQLADAVARHRQQAAPLRVDLVRAEAPNLAGMPFKVSGDGVQQLIMNTAQQLAFGRVRAVYEAVDMREYTAGRTECLRSATPQAAAFARAAAGSDTPSPTAAPDTPAPDAPAPDGTTTSPATPEDLLTLLGDAMTAHRDWVKTCKSGRGVDRHLLGLRLMLEQTGEHDAAATAFFADPGIARAREDFLSTTSVGGPAQIVRYVFAPTLAEGFGISYTPQPPTPASQNTPTTQNGPATGNTSATQNTPPTPPTQPHLEFCVTWRADAGAERAASFLRALEEAPRRFPAAPSRAAAVE